jgi:hypothetical protein
MTKHILKNQYRQQLKYSGPVFKELLHAFQLTRK